MPPVYRTPRLNCWTLRAQHLWQLVPAQREVERRPRSHRRGRSVNRVGNFRFPYLGKFGSLLTAGDVDLSHRAAQPMPKLDVALVEARPAIGDTLRLGPILLPQQLQRDALAPQLAMDLAEVGNRKQRVDVALRMQSHVQCRVIECLRFTVRQPRRSWQRPDSGLYLAITTRAWTRGRPRHISAIATSCTRCATPTLRPIALAPSGTIDPYSRVPSRTRRLFRRREMANFRAGSTGLRQCRALRLRLS